MAPLAAAPVPTYQDAYSSLGSVYDPQVASVQASEAPQMSALDQAKVNAFTQIGQQANAKGMTFSGFTPENEATYVGTKYLPAVANLHTSIVNAVNKLNAQRATQAQDIVTKGQQAANDAAYKNAQLGLSYARLNQSAANSAAKAAKAPTPTVQNVGSALYNQVKSNNLIGGDGHVSPATLAAMYNTWKSYGLQDAAFWKNYQGLWNPNQSNYGAMFNAAKNAR